MLTLFVAFNPVTVGTEKLVLIWAAKHLFYVGITIILSYTILSAITIHMIHLKSAPIRKPTPYTFSAKPIKHSTAQPLL